MSLPRNPAGPELPTDLCFCGYTRAMHEHVVAHPEIVTPRRPMTVPCPEFQSPRLLINTVANTLTDLVELLASRAGVRT